MGSPYQIESTEVERLNQEQLPRIMNLLLRSEAAQLHIPPENIETTLRVNDADGGIDAWMNNDVITRVDAGIAISRWIPADVSIWQFKATSDLVKADIYEELQKQEVKAAINEGAIYCLAVSGGMTSRKQKNLRNRLQEAMTSLYPGSSHRILLAEDIAEWTSNYPLMAFYFDHHIEEIFPLQHLLDRQNQHINHFEPDAARTAIIEEVRTRFESEDGPIHLRIQGPPGVGKTRLALEIFRDVASIVLYADEPPSNRLISWMALNHTVHAILVVDECEQTKAKQLFERAQLCQRRLRLLTIGHSSRSLRGDEIYNLQPLDKPTLERVVQSKAPVLSPDQVRWIARVSRGYVKLATVLAEQIAKGVTTVTHLTSAQDVYTILTQLLPDERQRRAMSGLSLLTRLGWEGEVEKEGEIIADFIGMRWPDMREAIAQVFQSGLVTKQGRYRYVTPEILALWLAGEAWQTQKSHLLNLLNRLPSAEARDAMIERLASLAGLEEVAEVVKSFLGPTGPFTSLDLLNNERTAKLFSILSKGHPESSLAALDRLFRYAEESELEQLRAGRRYIVWALERLAHRTETFTGAARLLRRLAEAENESFSNNATGVWASLFLTYLAPTEVPGIDRLPLVIEAISSDSPKTRLLAIQAVRAALSPFETGSILDDVRDGHVPPKQWRPQNREEELAYRQTILNIFDSALNDEDMTIREAALDTLLDAARTLVIMGLADDTLARLEKLTIQDEQQRRKAWQTVQSILRFEHDFLNEIHRGRLTKLLKQLYGDSFHDRIHRFLGKAASIDEEITDPSDRGALQVIIVDLADEAYYHPAELRAELPWLASQDAENVWFFGRRLGMLDEHHAWLQDILMAVDASKDYVFSSAYLQGCVDASADIWLEHLFDEWMLDSAKAPLILDATWRGETDARNLERVLELVDKGWIEPKDLKAFAYGGWVQGLTAAQISALLQRLTRDESVLMSEIGLAVILYWTNAHDKMLPLELENDTWLLLQRTSGHNTSMLGFYWGQIGQLLLHRDLTRVVEIIVSGMVIGNITAFTPQDPRLALLVEAFHIDHVRTWSIFSDYLLRNERVKYMIEWWAWETHILDTLDVSMQLSWCNGNERRATIIAQLVKPGEKITPLIRTLLSEYGPESSAARQLMANFGSGSWQGSFASREQQQLTIVQGWLQDPEPNVRTWAQSIAIGIEKQLPYIKEWEEESM